jgi:hypothetical protein
MPIQNFDFFFYKIISGLNLQAFFPNLAISFDSFLINTSIRPSVLFSCFLTCSLCLPSDALYSVAALRNGVYVIPNEKNNFMETNLHKIVAILVAL